MSSKTTQPKPIPHSARAGIHLSVAVTERIMRRRIVKERITESAAVKVAAVANKVLEILLDEATEKVIEARQSTVNSANLQRAFLELKDIKDIFPAAWMLDSINPQTLETVHKKKTKKQSNIMTLRVTPATRKLLLEGKSVPMKLNKKKKQ